MENKIERNINFGTQSHRYFCTSTGRLERNQDYWGARKELKVTPNRVSGGKSWQQAWAAAALFRIAQTTKKGRESICCPQGANHNLWAKVMDSAAPSIKKKAQPNCPIPSCAPWTIATSPPAWGGDAGVQEEPKLGKNLQRHRGNCVSPLWKVNVYN